jgi:mitochondrial fission protein ELM1
MPGVEPVIQAANVASMQPESWSLSEPYAGLQAQAAGLAEAAGFAPTTVELHPRAPWSMLPAAIWPWPLRAVGMRTPPQGLLFTAGGTAAAVGAALRPRGNIVVQIQHPRMPISRFDLIVANRHDELTGPNVITIRTALHRATQARLASARAAWLPRLAHLPRPLVAVLVGGGNGRFRLGETEAAALAASLAGMMHRDAVGLALTPSRRTAPKVRHVLASALAPRGAWIWDMTGENPYFGLLACADAIVVTTDSISMVSEAAATHAPVLLAELPGRSRRVSLFLDGLRQEHRVRNFDGRLQTWPVTPIDDTFMAAAEMRRRLGF